MGFIAPWLLGGLALASAPIIIHLLNRRRFTLVDWAPMRYLKLTLRTNRRRMRLEQWLLLLIRTLAILALFFAVARPFVSSGGMGGWLTGQSRTSRVIIIDDSLSMTLRGPSGQSALRLAKDRAAELIDKIGSQDTLYVVTSSRPDVPLMDGGFVEDASPLVDKVRQIQATDAASRWGSVFEVVDRHLRASAFESREVVLITDMRSAGWNGEVTEVGEKWAEEKVGMRIIDVGADEAPANIALRSLDIEGGLAMVGVNTVINATLDVDPGVKLPSDLAELTIDGTSRNIKLPDLSGGGEVVIPITHKFFDAGQHVLRLKLPDDALPADNAAQLAIDVRPSVNVLLVDGQPAATAYAGEVDFIAHALRSFRRALNVPYRVQIVSDTEWLSSPIIDAPDVVVLANVAVIPPDRARELEAMVRAGMGLMIFVGDQVSTIDYNQSLYRDGEGLLPAELLSPTDTEAQGLLVTPADGSPLAPLTAIRAERLADIVPKRIAQVKLSPDALLASAAAGDDAAGDGPPAPVRVLATWDAPDAPPAVIEKRFGDGRVLLWTITADRAWGDWVQQAAFVLGVPMATQTVAGGGYGDQTNLTAGEAIIANPDPNRPPTAAGILPPGGDAPIPATLRAAGEDNANAKVIRYDDTLTAGLYRLTWQRADKKEQTLAYAVNPDRDESNLTTITAERVDTLLGSLKPKVIDLGSGESATDRAEIWRVLVFALLGFVLIESALAAYVGRER